MLRRMGTTGGAGSRHRLIRRAAMGRWLSFRGARDAVRRLKAKGVLSEPVHVIFAEGTYSLAEPLVLEAVDSGTEKCPIVYEAAPQARPVFSGGRVLRGFRKGADGVWSLNVPEVKAGQWYFEQLYVNGQRAVRARSPNKFYYWMRGKVESGVDPLTGKTENLANRAFLGRSARSGHPGGDPPGPTPRRHADRLSFLGVLGASVGEC